jgi:hypothetical protein
MKYLKVFILLLLPLGFISCTSIGFQQMTYLGQDSTIPDVIGSSHHFDIMGIGNSAEKYAIEYERALSKVFYNSPKGTTKIENLKTFKAQNWEYQILGILIAGIGYTFKDSNSASTLGYGLVVGGAIVASVNSYDFILIGEPVQ